MKREILIIIGSLIALGSTSCSKDHSLQNKVLGSNDGRFVFGQISSMDSNQYMLDTKTGRLWKKITLKLNGKVTDEIKLKPILYKSYGFSETGKPSGN